MNGNVIIGIVRDRFDLRFYFNEPKLDGETFVTDEGMFIVERTDDVLLRVSLKSSKLYINCRLGGIYPHLMPDLFIKYMGCKNVKELVKKHFLRYDLQDDYAVQTCRIMIISPILNSKQLCHCGKGETPAYSPCCSLSCWIKVFE